MNPDLLRLQQLLQQDSWTREELDWLRTYLQDKGTTGLNEVLRQCFEDDLILANKIDPQTSTRMRERLLNSMGISAQKQPSINMQQKGLLMIRPAMAAATVLLVILTGGMMLFRGSKKVPATDAHTQAIVTKAPIVPGCDKATLRLANGSVIALDSTRDGSIKEEASAGITKHGSQLSYADGKDGIQQPEITYNLLTTPKGGQFQVILQDGTHVWLNAASSLRFPTAFGGKERLVEMTGEAYFEVAPQKDKPFRIRIGNRMQAEVLGTTLNIMAYQEEPAITTTLVDGSVRLETDSIKTLLKPGQEGRMDRLAGTATPVFRVAAANVESALAWKNGLFQFEDASIETIMRQVARWYDVDIDYQMNRSNQVYSGTMPRKEHIDSLLKLLQYTGTVHFTVEGRKIVVTR